MRPPTGHHASIAARWRGSRSAVLGLVIVCVAATTLTAALRAHGGAGSDQAQPELHPAVRARIDDLHSAAEGRHVKLTRLFGRYDPNDQPVLILRRAHGRDDPLPAFSQPATLADAAAQSDAPADWSVGLPKGFDWRSYVQYHPEWASELDCEWKAAQHYKQHGAASGRWHTRLRVILRYTVLGGLVNQQTGHMSAIMLAAATGAELMVAPAFTRGSFATDEFSTPWVPLPIDQLLNMPHVVRHWQQRGLIIHPSPELVSKPNRRAGPAGIYTGTDLRPELITKLPVPGYGGRDLDDVAEVLRNTTVGHAERLRAQDASTEIPYIVVDITGWCWAVKFTSAPRLAWETFSSLRFAPKLTAAADSMVAKITKRFPTFNGVHLRLEADMQAAPFLYEPLGNAEDILSAYLGAMHQLNFSSTVPVYVGSGLFGYNSSSAAHIKGRMNADRVGTVMFHKKMLLPASTEAGLAEIQRSAVDILVLTRSDRFVGFAASSYSSFVMFHRMLHGFSGETNSFVGKSFMVHSVSLWEP